MKPTYLELDSDAFPAVPVVQVAAPIRRVRAMNTVPCGRNPTRRTSEVPLGYRGQPRERDAPWQCLGNGSRVYSLVLMRFQSPDHLSPFADGGLNAYTYCGGDPINFADPTGHALFPMAGLLGMASLATGAVALAAALQRQEQTAMMFAVLSTVLAGASIGVAGLRAVRATPPSVRLVHQGLGPNDLAVLRGPRFDVVQIDGGRFGSRMGSKYLNGNELAEELARVGGGRFPAKPTELQSPFSAAGKKGSQAQVLASSLKKNVRGFSGEVLTRPGVRTPTHASQSSVFAPQVGGDRTISTLRNRSFNRDIAPRPRPRHLGLRLRGWRR